MLSGLQTRLARSKMRSYGKIIEVKTAYILCCKEQHVMMIIVILIKLDVIE